MKTFYEKAIINNIEFDRYELAHVNDMIVTDFENILSVYAMFVEEYGFMIERVGESDAFCEWLQGLPSVLTVPFMNYEILSNAKQSGIIINDEDKFLEDYWTNLTNAFFTLKNNL